MANKNREDGAESAGTSEIALELAEKIRYLLEANKKSISEVEKGTDGQLRYMWLWKLSHGQIEKPSYEALKTLGDFFNVPVEFWDSSLKLNDWKKKVADNQQQATQSKENMQRMVGRYLDLEPNEQQILLEVMESMLRRHGK